MSHKRQIHLGPEGPSLLCKNFKNIIDDMLDEIHAHLVIADYEKAKKNGTLKTRPIEELFTELDL